MKPGLNLVESTTAAGQDLQASKKPRSRRQYEETSHDGIASQIQDPCGKEILFCFASVFFSSLTMFPTFSSQKSLDKGLEFDATTQSPRQILL